ncbi:DGQHR domain-containing protein [Stenotrophomonas maltophilia]|nr:DGQHR domain-containing protein [Stenotrophomonas maltophilia]MBA0469233.1 DGQHR domain-containing protein [Stenotrophomonas maltophilia]MBA0476801.1 DGQHR domain-containing protein [Stenotrophomonas maltophilia]MBA0485288.1 DGQHR domain-containing protein [Stenotrophomonas maltophilia]
MRPRQPGSAIHCPRSNLVTQLNSAPNILWTTPNREAVVGIKVKNLRNLFVSTYDTQDPDSPAPNKHGYQRNPDERRFKPIGEYFAENPYLVPPILVSVRVDVDSDIRTVAELLAANNMAEIAKRYGHQVASVIDGQHRIGGMLHAAKFDKDFAEFLVPVTLFFGLSFEAEAEVFNTINSSQRKLPKALIEVTRGDISEREELTHAQMVRKIAFGIARDKDSVWFDQINMTGGRAPSQKVTYEGLRRSVANMFPANLLSRLRQAGLDPLDDAAKPFWRKVGELFPDAWNGRSRTVTDPDTNQSHEETVQYRLKELVGVASLSRLGQDIMSSSVEAYQEYGIDFDKAMSKKMSRLAHVDWEKTDTNPWMASQAGFAGQAKLYGDLHKLVYEGVDPNGNAVD